MKELEIYIDGASKGNPGPSGIGIVVCQDGRTVKNISNYIGESTNNVAEYTALIFGLQEALIQRADRISILTDSELLYRQINRVYKIKSPAIMNLYRQAQHLMSAFKGVSVRHIPREHNRGADKLASLAVKEEMKKKGV